MRIRPPRPHRVLPPGVWAYASPFRTGDVQWLFEEISKGTTALFYGLVLVSA